MIKKLSILTILYFLPAYGSLETVSGEDIKEGIKAACFVINLSLLSKTEHPCQKAAGFAYLSMWAVTMDQTELAALATTCAVSYAAKRKQLNFNISSNNLAAQQ